MSAKMFLFKLMLLIKLWGYNIFLNPFFFFLEPTLNKLINILNLA